MGFLINLNLAFRNVFRNQIRSLITIMAIAFGSVSIIIAGGFFEDTFMKMRESVIHTHLGHIQINKKGFGEKGSTKPFDYLIQDPSQIINKIVALKHVKLVTPRVSFSGMVSTGENTVAVFCQGVVPENENNLNLVDGKSTLAIEEGGPLIKADEFEMLLGKGLAKNMGAHVGDSLVLLTNTVNGSLNAFDMDVKGLFYTSSKEFDDRVLRLPIKVAQKLIRTSDVQTLVVLLDETKNTTAVKKNILDLTNKESLDIEVKTWDQLADFYTKTVELYGRQFFVLKIIITVIVILSIFNTINMAIWERTPEIGTILAMGYKKRDILTLFLTEGGILGITGGIAGIFVGISLAGLISLVGIPMPPPPGATVGWTAMIKIVPDILLISFLIAVVSSLISSFYPAYKASNLVITEALRHY